VPGKRKRNKTEKCPHLHHYLDAEDEPQLARSDAFMRTPKGISSPLRQEEKDVKEKGSNEGKGTQMKNESVIGSI